MKVFIWFLFFLPIVYAAGNYDYFQLVLQWPPPVCTSHSCTPHPVPPNFIIHGFRPSNSCEPEPPVCPGTFNISEIEDLIPELAIYWPNLTGDDIWLWRKEWETYGNCSEDRFNEYAYFRKALDLRENIDILGILDDGGIKPLPPKVVYRKNDISNVIEHGGHNFNGTGHKPRLWCSEDNELLEISVCYDLDLAYMDCPLILLNNPRNQCNECVGFPDHPPPASTVSY